MAPHPSYCEETEIVTSCSSFRHEETESVNSYPGYHREEIENMSFYPASHFEETESVISWHPTFRRDEA